MPTPLVAVRVALTLAGLTLACAPSWSAQSPAAAASSVSETSFAVPIAAQLQAGAKVAQTCAACHGLDGNATSTEFPKLAGQHVDYLIKQLHDYRIAKGASHPARVNAIMNGMAATLTDAQIRDVALYYSRQTFRPGVAFADKKEIKLGQSIWMAGIPDRAVPACAACHGPSGEGMPSRYPRIGGQWQGYLETELQMFRNDRRTNSPEMHDIASRMTDRQISAVADFAAGLRAWSERSR
ncbi:MAG: c-type cytochrome [Thiomonas sp.]|uniref:c-type cytochrome n=1 Tax=Thiomonas sp. TaxID=2047785 RepID=UPI002A369502|nr:c-type cytochrome [Thiomonas sp.]MDY0329517.1 c-type cytochrome [Thiomonas sp.]